MPADSARPEEPQPLVIPLWPEGAPGSEGWTHREEEAVAGERIKVVRNVAQPSLTVYLPDPKVAVGTAAIVCPGGGFHMLSIDMEGNHVARWLAGRGIAACVLKYRLIRTGDDFPGIVWKRLADRDGMRRLLEPLVPLLLEDARRAVGLVRAHAVEWGVEPNRVGMLGFSAGGSVTVNCVLASDRRLRPDFAAAIYSADHLDLPVPADAPPLFVLCAADDNMASPISLGLYSAWRDAGREAELHIYARGGHGFGMRERGASTDGWIERYWEWLVSECLVEVAL